MSLNKETSLEQDIPIFIKDVENIESIKDKLYEFVKEKYNINENFFVQYQDKEEDFITIGSSSDLEEAYRQAEENDTILKLHVVPEEIGVPVYSFTTQLEKEIPEEKEESKSSDDEEEEVNPVQKLLHDLSENPEFQDEFVHFAKAFLVTLQENMNSAATNAFAQSLSAHEGVAKHPASTKLGELLPGLLAQFPGLFFGVLSSIDTNNIGDYLKMIIQMTNGLHNNGFPFWMHMMGGGFPPFGGRRHQHGRHGGCYGKKRKCCGRNQSRNCEKQRCGGNWKNRQHCGRRFEEKKSSRCNYDAKIIKSDLSLPNDGYILPKQIGIKTWLVKNTGSVDWPEGVKIVYAGRPFNPMIDGVEFPVKALKVGEEVEVTVVVNAPPESGRYASRWRLSLPSNGKKFGQCFKCAINVVGLKVEEEEEEEEEEEKKVAVPKFKKKEELKRDVLLKQRAKIAAQLSKLDGKISKKEERQRLKAQRKANKASLKAAAAKAKKKDETIDKKKLEEKEVVVVAQNEPLVDEEKKEESDSSLSVEIVCVEDLENLEEEEDVLQTDEPVLVSNVVASDPSYKYQDQLSVILGMGFDDIDKVKGLLETHEGNIQVVLNRLL